MQKLEVLIEENAFGSVRPVEVVADAPVSALIPALVEEFKLPQTDLFGQNLNYKLRRSSGGSTIPEQSTLLASGVAPGEILSLESYTARNDQWATVGVQSFNASNTNAATFNTPNANASTLHSSMTLTDFSAASPTAGVQSLPTQFPDRPKKRNMTRRAFLVAGVLALGTGGGYAAYSKFLAGRLHHIVTPVVVKTPPMPKKQNQPTTMRPTAPTKAQLQTTFARHQQMVRTLAWSPDGKNLASGADDAQLFVWDTGGAIKLNIAHPAPVRTLAWSPDGQRLVTGSGVQVAFFDARTGNALARPAPVHTQLVTSVAWATHGLMQVVSGSADTRAVVWDTNAFRAQTIYRLHTAEIEHVAWTADGLNVATSSAGGFIRLWAAANGGDVHAHYQDAAVPTRALAFSPVAAQLAAGGDDGFVRIWNMATACQNVVGQGVINARCADVPERIHVSGQVIRTLAWSNDGKYLAVGADDGVVSVWDPANAQKPLLTIQQNAAVQSVTWSPDNKMLALAAGTTATTWMLM